MIVKELFVAADATGQAFPFAGSVQCGFPSPADDFVMQSLDLNSYLIKHPDSTFFVKARGNSMKDAGIDNGDILAVDKSLQPVSNDIAVCWLDGQFTVKRIRIEKDIVWLVPENSEFEPIKVTADNELTIWGVIISIIKRVR